MVRIWMISALSLTLSCSGPQGPQVPHQISGKPDVTVEEARTIPPFPPGHITVKPGNTGFVVSWSANPLDPTLTYKIYRITGKSRVEVGKVKGGTFVDPVAPRRNVAYSVSTVNQFDVESVASKAVQASR